MTYKYNKTVLMPIEVPVGKYCWDSNRRICEHFSNEGGYGECSLGFYPLKRNKKGQTIKPKECNSLGGDYD